MKTFISGMLTSVLELADSAGAFETVPRKTAIMENRSNTPSDSIEEHYKRTVAIPLLDNISGSDGSKV